MNSIMITGFSFTTILETFNTYRSNDNPSSQTVTSTTETRVDNRLLRGQETRRLLMHAAEKLIANKGLEQVSIREILNEAQQNNASALQYHFGNLKGLVAAIQAERSNETRAKRTELMDALLATTAAPNLRQLCELMIRPLLTLPAAGRVSAGT